MFYLEQMIEPEHAPPGIDLPPDFTGTVASPVTTVGSGLLAYPIRHIREYVCGECVASYNVRIKRRPR